MIYYNRVIRACALVVLHILWPREPRLDELRGRAQPRSLRILCQHVEDCCQVVFLICSMYQCALTIEGEHGVNDKS